MSRNLNDLDNSIYYKAKQAIEIMQNDRQLKDAGVSNVFISETRRALSTQMAYYSRSRMSVSDVKKMYKAAGLYDISESEAKTPNTWTLESKHLNGKAIDIVPEKNGKAWWSAPAEVWERMGKIGEECGMNWGGRWKTKDCPHFEV